MNAANIKTSHRLRLVWGYLKAQGKRGATTRQIIEATGQVAINSCIAEIRAGGRRVTCRFEGRTLEGNSIYRYKLA